MPTSFDNIPRNPVGRLHRLLSRVPAANNKLGDWLVSYFDVQNPSSYAGIELFADLAHLVGECQRAAANVPNYTEDDLIVFRAPIDRVSTVISTLSPNSYAYELNNQIAAETLTGLEFFSRILSREKPEVAVDPTQLEELLTQVQELIADVISSDIESELKALLVEHLQAVEKSLRLYSILGSAGLRRAASGLIGSAYIGAVEHPDQNSRSWVDKCFRVGNMIAAATGLVANARTAYPELLEHFQKLPQLLGG